MGLRLVMQPRPLCPALYAISVRRLGTLPAASFRFHLAMDTLAVRLTLPTTKRVVDFHHQAIAHGGRTTVLAGENFPRQYHPFRGSACHPCGVPGRQIRRNAFLLSDGKLTFAKILLGPAKPVLRISLKGAAAPFKTPKR